MSRKQSTDSSLELLLDTITNTFGSILFLTILVTLLLRASGGAQTSARPIQTPMSARDQAMIASRIEDAAREFERLQQRLASFPASDPGLATIQTAIINTTSEASRITAEEGSIATRTLEAQRITSAVTDECEKLDTELADLTPRAIQQEERRRKLEQEAATLAKLAIDLDRPVDPAKIVQTAVLPVIGETDKKQVGLYMRYGRLYVMHQWSEQGERLGPNAEHFIVAPEPDGKQVAMARPDAGVIVDGNSIERDLQTMLRRFPSEAWTIAVVVYADSFSQFQTVKATLVSLGYEYEPIHTGVDDPVSDRGGTARAQ